MNKRLNFLLMVGLIFSVTNLPAQSLANKLATLEKGTYVAEDDKLVKRFDNLLDQVDKEYDVNKQQISNMTYKLKELLNEKGVVVSMVKVMEGAVQTKVKEYATYLGYYLTLKEKGYDHNTIIESILIAEAMKK